MTGWHRRWVRRLRLSGLAVATFAAVIGLAAPAWGQGPPLRVVSINVCADQYLLALADPEQILALSPFAADRGMAFFADRTDGVPLTSGHAEAVMALDPDLVIAGTFTKRATRSLLRRLGFPVLEIAPARSWDDVRDQTRMVAEVLGYPERADPWVEALDLALEAADGALDGQAAADRLRALHYQRRGYVTGTDTLMDQILRAGGLANAAAEAGVQSVRPVSLEQVVELRPDLLIADRPEIRLTDVGIDLLRHPALDRATPDQLQIVLPQRLTVCGGPSLVEAIGTLQAAVQALPDQGD